MTINVLEIRNYLLKPNMLEHFIDYFEAHFIATQEAENMHVLGQFRLIGEPDHFVWLRGFSDLPTRLTGLQNFYGGPVWKKYGSRANSMMIDSDNVHLLRPLNDNFDLTAGGTWETGAAELEAGTISPDTGIIAIDYYHAKPNQLEAVIGKFQADGIAAYRDAGIQLRGIFVAEMRENEFPSLPVFQYENQLTVITAYANEAAREIATRPLHQSLNSLLGEPPKSLLLQPTLRSPLRYQF